MFFIKHDGVLNFFYICFWENVINFIYQIALIWKGTRIVRSNPINQTDDQYYGKDTY